MFLGSLRHPVHGAEAEVSGLVISAIEMPEYELRHARPRLSESSSNCSSVVMDQNGSGRRASLALVRRGDAPWV
jgi:hypothetical protein